jgi:outer membrane protein TolC
MTRWLLALGMGLATFAGSMPAQPLEEMPLSLADAVAKGLKANLAVVAAEIAMDSSAAGERRAFAALLPKLNITVAESARQTNLAAFGFTGFGGAFPGFRSVVGPFALFDARANLTAPLVDRSARLERRSTIENQGTSRETAEDARDTIASLVASLYYQSVALESRLKTAEAQRDTAKALLQQAQDQKAAGGVAGIVVLRAQVQLQSDEQRVIASRNDWAKKKLQLANAISLPLTQPIRLTDTNMSDAPVALTAQQAVTEALQTRADYRSTASRIRAAELHLQAVRAERRPTVGAQADYGVIGQKPTAVHGTFSATIGLRVPVFEGGRVEADISQADAQLRDQQARQKSLGERIDLEVRTTMLDVDSAALRVAAARVATTLADLQLEQARDRFAAGVSDNLEVVQSQTAVAVAQDNYIAGLLELQLAKAALARALGQTERNLGRFLTGRTQ